MKRFGNLFSQIVSFENMVWAARRAVRGKKSKIPAARLYLDFEHEVIRLLGELTRGDYQPKPYHQFKIYEPKERKICSSDIRDRVVHHAICRVIEPYFERRLIHDSYACRVGKGSHRAIQRCQAFARRYRYFLKCDIAKYFESIDQKVLIDLLNRVFKDEQLLQLLGVIIHHAVPGAPEGKGLPIGNLTSQHFANLYLGELDHFIKEQLRVGGYLRYMDDYALFHDSKEFLGDALNQVTDFVESKLLLSLKQKATVLAPTAEGIPFLGFRVFPGLIRIQRKNLVRMRRKISQRERAFMRGEISEKGLVQSLNSVMAHAAHANSTILRRKEILRSLKMA